MSMDDILNCGLTKSLIVREPMSAPSSRFLKVTEYVEMELMLDFVVGAQTTRFISSRVVDSVVLDVRDCV